MSGKSTTLAIKIVSDASGAKAGFAEAEAEADGFGEKLKKANLALAATVGGVAEMAEKAYEAAGQLEHAGETTESVFGSQAEEVQKYAAKADQAAGLSEAAYETLATTVGQKLANMGVAHDELADKTNNLVQMGANLAAQYGGSTQDAVTALTKGLAGQTKGLQAYGVVLKASDINAVLAANGQSKLTGEALRNATAMASLQLIQQQSASTTGAFGKQAETAEGQQKRLTAEWQNAEAKLGTMLLPAMAKLMGILANLAGWGEQHTKVIVGLGIAFGGVALAVLAAEGAVRAWEAAEKVATAAQWLWNVAMDANPISLIVIAVVALIAGFVLAYEKCKPFREIINDIGKVVKEVFAGIGWYFETFWIKPLTWVWDKLSKLAGMARSVGHVLGFGGGNPAAGQSAGGRRYGAMAGGGVAPLRFGGAFSDPLAGVGPSPAGAGQGDTTVVNVTINGALDPIATGRQVVNAIREYSRATGRQLVVSGA